MCSVMVAVADIFKKKMVLCAQFKSVCCYGKRFGAWLGRCTVKPVLCLGVSLGLCVQLAGCASGILRVDTVTLNHRMPDVRTLPAPPVGLASVALEVQDRRTDAGGWLGGQLGKRRVGHAENGFGESVAPHIALDQAVEAVFAQALQAELMARGLTVQPGAPWKLVLQVDHFYCKFRRLLGMYVAVADLHMTASLFGPDGRSLSEIRIASQGESEPSFWQEGKTAEVALNRALDAGLVRLFAEQGWSAFARQPVPVP